MGCQGQRPDWDTYFMQLAKLAATRSTCISQKVGCVIVEDHRVLSTGYNGVPSGLPHCTDQGFCQWEDDEGCSRSKSPSRAIHAEANAIAQAAKGQSSIEGASIYTTHEPCINCLKLIVAAGIKRVYFQEPGDGSNFKTEVFDRLIEFIWLP